jgi:SAM-dependent methyltransferase
MMHNDNESDCLLCGGSAELRHNEYPGYQEPDKFMIYHCQKCNTAFSLPRVETSVLYENIYKNGDKVPGYNRYWRYSKIIGKFENPLEYLEETKEVYWGVKEALSVSVKDKKSSRILEIGSGLGYLTYSLIRADYNAKGLDISQTAVNKANETFGDHYIRADLSEYADQFPESYDVVILTEVIEHVADPLDFIKNIIKLLKPGGRAIVTTPNKSFYPSGINWASDLPPVHCWWFSEDSIRYIAERLKTEISFIDFTNYYKKHYQIINIRSLLNCNLPNPYFDRNGELIKKAARSKYILKSYIQLLLTKMPVADKASGRLKECGKRAYGKSREFFNKDIITCRERGIVLCAILQKG